MENNTQSGRKMVYDRLIPRNESLGFTIIPQQADKWLSQLRAMNPNITKYLWLIRPIFGEIKERSSANVLILGNTKKMNPKNISAYNGDVISLNEGYSLWGEFIKTSRHMNLCLDNKPYVEVLKNGEVLKKEIEFYKASAVLIFKKRPEIITPSTGLSTLPKDSGVPEVEVEVKLKLRTPFGDAGSAAIYLAYRLGYKKVDILGFGDSYRKRKTGEKYPKKHIIYFKKNRSEIIRVCNGMKVNYIG